MAYEKQKIIKKPKKITEQYLYNSGLAYLQRFPASTAHFKKIMQRKINRSCKAHPDVTAESCHLMLEKTIAKFETLGLLNDEFYLKGMVASYRNRGLSTTVIIQKLSIKGYSSSVIKEEIEKLATEYDQDNDSELIAAIKCCRKKRLGPFCAKNIDHQKQLSTLARQGFSYDIAQKALNTPLDSAEEFIRH